MIKIIFLFIVLILFSKLCSSIEIVLVVDLTSKVKYSGFNCGGSIEIVNGIQSNQSFPPCTSITDAGQRSYGFNQDLKYNDSSLLILLKNYDGSVIKTKDNLIIKLKSYCYFEIKVIDNPNITITMEQTNKGEKIFLDYSLEYNLVCTDYKPRVVLKNMKLIGWNYAIIILNNTDSYVIKKASFEFSSIIVEESVFFITSRNTNYQGKTNIIIKDSIFKNLYTNLMGFIWSQNNIYLYNSTFNNYVSQIPLIQALNSILYIENCRFININIPSLSPMILSYSYQTTMSYIYIEGCALYSIIYIECIGDQTNYISNVIISNSQFLNSNLKPFIIFNRPQNGVFIISNNINSLPLILNNITFLPNNIVVPQNKFFLNSNSLKLLNISNSIISNKVQNLIYGNRTQINFLNGNYIDIKNLVNGSNNIINYFYRIHSAVPKELNSIQSCSECDENYYIQEEKIETNVTETPTISNSFSKEKISNSFKMLYLIPIIICPILLIFFIGFFVNYKLKKEKKNRSSTIYNNGEATIELDAVPS
ncbi:hypothetical protein DICPUDRAFT_76068 [Dictyostelium purpureum]|uniref:Transmembrane protein n=1 Tax=Dictyostelium purpureum TaxID=5786 RepID=F0ZCH9_DICPU|nr:uncharacterized protein DICPUDRAFT_76068 [Dictyostelium purpureum]EGC38350.1 hypothetical protein DICPUDRAFT_76068 [Dictyostelium purpureum]|eukprot:XP_003285107.1 hypothetical protein DICPUDRAFT_76068 [Dictyostelium purpureum]